MSKKRCENCMFWEQNQKQIATGGDYIGDCHRYPPRIEQDKTDTNHSDSFPVVHADDWCGEYKHKATTIISEDPLPLDEGLI